MNVSSAVCKNELPYGIAAIFRRLLTANAVKLFGPQATMCHENV